MRILKNFSAIRGGVPMAFVAVEGVEPYVYSVAPQVAGQPPIAGGSINAATGAYVAPIGAFGSDTIIATDADGEEVETELFVAEPLDLVLDILRKEMDLADDQAIIYNQRFKIPKDSRIYIVLRILDSQVFSNNRRTVVDGSGLAHDQMVSVRDRISLDIYSRSESAIQRRFEIPFALKSAYAANQQAGNSFFSASIPSSFVNLSVEEGTSLLYRFNMSFNVKYAKALVKPSNYFDQFESVGIITND